MTKSNWVHFSNMRLGNNNFNYFPENKLIKLANLVHFKRMLVFFSEGLGGMGPLGSLCLCHC